MRIEVVGIKGGNHQSLQVEFVTDFGQGRGEWKGFPPRVGEQYSVELAIGDTLAWGATIKEADFTTFSIGQEGDVFVLQGKLESVDADGEAAIRLGPSITLVTTIGTALSPGTFVRIRAKSVELYDSNT